MHTDGLGGAAGRGAHIQETFPTKWEGDPETGQFSPGGLRILIRFGSMGWDPSSCFILIALNTGCVWCVCVGGGTSDRPRTSVSRLPLDISD